MYTQELAKKYLFQLTNFDFCNDVIKTQTRTKIDVYMTFEIRKHSKNMQIIKIDV